MALSELKPCPFCGSEARFARLSRSHGGVKCRSCNAGTDLCDNEAEAIAAWNTRQEGPAPAQVQAANALIKELEAERDNALALLAAYVARIKALEEELSGLFAELMDPDVVIARMSLSDEPLSKAAALLPQQEGQG